MCQRGRFESKFSIDLSVFNIFHEKSVMSVKITCVDFDFTIYFNIATPF